VRWPVFVGIALVLGGAAIIPLMLRSANVSSTRPARPNVLLITIDTLRWDRVGAYGAAHNPTPVLDRLASRGTRFETAIAHAPLTAPSHASILTGLTPVRNGVRDNGAFVLAEQITLASTLRAAGYSTAAFVSGFPLDRRFGFAAGFQTYDDRLPGTEGAGRAAYTERRADDTTARALAWLGAAASTPPASRGSQPWFLWIHYFDPHASYDPPEPWKSKMPSPYDGEVAFVDDQIGRVLGRLSEIGATSQTIVAVTADHGESLGEHGEETHGVFIYDATLRVPLIMAGPGISTGTVATVVGRGVDVMPTLLDLAGLQVPERLDGRTLRTALEGRLMDDEGAYIESLLAERQFGWAPLRGLRDARWKYIDSPEPELYDLLHDAGELKNRATEAPRRTEALATNLADKLKATATPDRQRPQMAMDREAAERLRALGYVSGGAARPASGNRRNPKGGIQLINRLERGVAKVRVDPRRAVDELRAVLVEDPGIAVARSQLAVALSYTGDRNGAIEQLRILTADRTASAEDLVLLSELHRAAGNSAKAAEALQQAATLDPQSPEVALTEGRSFMIARDLEKAAAAFDRALKVSPDNSEALVGLGEVAMAKGDVNGAGATFERVLSGDPTNPAARLRLGLIRGRQGRMDEAIALIKPVAAAKPENPEALAALAAALARTGRPQEAVPYFERAVAAGQQSPHVLNGLGFAKLESGDRSGALTVLRRSLTIEPNQPQVQQAVRDLTERSRSPSNK
jgi:arylsulfatase A-like enzyme/Flp pilus assembly protein TadD